MVITAPHSKITHLLVLYISFYALQTGPNIMENLEISGNFKKKVFQASKSQKHTWNK